MTEPPRAVQPVPPPPLEPTASGLPPGDTSSDHGARPRARGEREQLYLERAKRHREVAQGFEERSRLLSNLRGLSFAAMVIFGAWSVFGHPGSWVGYLALLALVTFIVLVIWHSRIMKQEDMALRWLHVNQLAVARCNGDWKQFHEDGAQFSNPIHPYSGDLDLFGHHSVFQRINVACTQYGQKRLASFLMNRCSAEIVMQRQQAVRELVPLLDWRQELEALGLASAPPLEPPPGGTKRRKPQSVDPEVLLGWAESAPQFVSNVPLRIVAHVAPLTTLGVLVAAFSLDWHPITWLGMLIGQALLLLTARIHSARVFGAVSSSQGVFLRFGPMLRLLETLEADSQRLTELRAAICSDDGLPPSSAMRHFERIVGWFELRHNGLVYPFINGLLLWDIHCVMRLERWQRQFGPKLRSWFKALGEVEALSSLAGFGADNPGFTWPNVSTGAACFDAEELGHPLLGSSVRKTNSVSLAQPGTALLVTGSNMSGKSTLLRSMGVNLSLALAGGPVCAKRLVVTPMALRTSMRISDSLEEGVSHFYAEVRKLKGVLDALQEDVPVFFLLDEILHGTNSRERQIGARWVLAELLKRGAIGAVSTHDTGLCELPGALMSQVTQVHFRETVEGDKMTFDYRLRPGPVTSGNALRVMRYSGIPVPLE